MEEIPLNEWGKIQLRVVACVVFMGLLVGFVFTHDDDVTESPYIDVVKDGHLDHYSETTVSKAFNYYFIKPYWRYYEARTGEHVVELSGTAMYAGEEGEASLQFIVEDDQSAFQLGALKVNNIVQEREDKNTLIEAVYTAWNNSNVVH